MQTWAWIDGAVLPADRARVAIGDRGLQLGEGVFETCKVVHGVPFALTRHLRRLRASADRVGLALPADHQVRVACEAVADAAVADATSQTGVGRLRITLTGGPTAVGSGPGATRPTLFVTAGPAPERRDTADVATVRWVINERSAISGAKTTSRADLVAAQAEARRLDADEAILANTLGVLCEGTSANVFLAVAGRLATPSLKTGCLPGITRALLIEVVEVVERDDLTLDDLRHSPEAFLASSLRDVQPIASVDGRALRAVPGPLTTAAMRAFAAVQAKTLDP